MGFLLFGWLSTETAGTRQCIRIIVLEDKEDLNSISHRLRNLSTASGLSSNAAADRIIDSGFQSFLRCQVLKSTLSHGLLLKEDGSSDVASDVCSRPR